MTRFYFKKQPNHSFAYSYIEKEIGDTLSPQEEESAQSLSIVLTVLDFQLNAVNTPQIAAEIVKLTELPCYWKIGEITELLVDSNQLDKMIELIKGFLTNPQKLKAIL